MTARFEYRVIAVREGLIGDKVSTDKLEKALNEQARDGWQVKAVTAADVKGRIGPGASEGLIVTLERPVS